VAIVDVQLIIDHFWSNSLAKRADTFAET